jgi:hypothetical protein
MIVFHGERRKIVQLVEDALKMASVYQDPFKRLSNVIEKRWR